MTDAAPTLTIDRSEYDSYVEAKRRKVEAEERAAEATTKAKRLQIYLGIAVTVGGLSVATVSRLRALGAEDQRSIDNAARVDGHLDTNSNAIDDLGKQVDANTQAIGANRAEIRDMQRIGVETYDAVVGKGRRASSEPDVIESARTKLGMDEP